MKGKGLDICPAPFAANSAPPAFYTSFVRNITSALRNRRSSGGSGEPNWIEELHSKIVGQSEGLGTVIPYVQMYQAGLSPEGRPAGVFLLLGPTGTGKTRTVEALAEVLHGSQKNVLRIDCGEFQLDHEVAKLIGAPPGYLGHRETQPMLTQMKLNAVASEKLNLSIVLFDEIEKAAGSMTRLMLGVLDKGALRLGDNTSVNFDRSLIFMTSNLGAKEMARQLNPDFGFETLLTERASASRVSAKKLESVCMAAVKRKFSPEFINRIDVFATYSPLTRASLELILEQQLTALQDHLDRRLLDRSFTLTVPKESREFLLNQGTSHEYGARELKRVIHRFVIQPLAALVSQGMIESDADVSLDVDEEKQKLLVRSGLKAA